MPGNYRHEFRMGQQAIAKLHTVTYDLERMEQHAIRLEQTLYRLARTILLDKLVDLDGARGLAFPSADIATHLSDPWTQAQLFAALHVATDLTAHLCDSCEGLAGEEDRPCMSCNGTGMQGDRVTTEDRIRLLIGGGNTSRPT